MTIANRIVTRGFGPTRGVVGRSGPVTLGYGGIPKFVYEAVQEAARVIIRGGSGADIRKELYPIIVWAKLVEINNSTPKREIKGQQAQQPGTQHVSVAVDLLSNRRKSVFERIKVRASQLIVRRK